MDSFQDKVTVITGGASGVGRALAKRLGREGARLLITDIEIKALNTTIEELKDQGMDVEGRQLDVTDRDAVFSTADYAFEKFGEVDCVFNNAGVGAGGGATNWEIPEKAFRWGMEVNFFGPLYGVQAYVPRMLEQNKEGIISATASGAGIVFPPMAPAYCSAKAALVAQYETLSHQLQMMSAQLRVALLFPGPHVVNTALMNSQRNLPKEFEDETLRKGTGITDMDSFQEIMKSFLGHEVDITEPEDFADYAHDALLAGNFWIFPTTDLTKKAIQIRFEEMLNETSPSIPKMM